MRRYLQQLFLLILMVFCFRLPAVTQEIGAVTLVEGNLRVIRGATLYKAPEGSRLRRGDILETSSPGFAQLELSGGTVLALGPSSRVLLYARTPAMTELVVLAGWLKAEVGKNSGTYRQATPLLAAISRDGTLLMQANENASEIYVESGSAGVATVNEEGILGRPAAAKAGQYFSRRNAASVTSSARPDSAFLGAMPVAFRDTLPPRLARFTGKAVDLQRDHDVSYPEVEAWLTMPARWRVGFVERFQPRLKDPEFRRALEAHLNRYPEWDPIFHPEKYNTKTQPASQTRSETSTQR